MLLGDSDKTETDYIRASYKGDSDNTQIHYIRTSYKIVPFVILQKWSLNLFIRQISDHRMVEQIEKQAIRSDSKEFRLYPGVYKNLHDKLVAFVEKGLQQNEHSKIYNNKTKRWRIVKDTSNPSNVILIMNIPAKNNKPVRDVILLPRRQQIGEILKTVLSKIPDDGKRLSDNECVKTLHETNLWISRNRIQMILGL
ncbi:unnamed protein product, partial [Didymodactylos carnosus]